MKVLLKTLKRSANHIKRSLGIWLLTGALGSFYLWYSDIIGLPYHEILILSLVFSGPAIMLLIPNFHLLQQLPTMAMRIGYSFLSVLFFCLLIALLFLMLINGYPLERNEIVTLMLPYTVAAEVSFFVVSRKLILYHTFRTINP